MQAAQIADGTLAGWVAAALAEACRFFPEADLTAFELALLGRLDAGRRDSGRIARAAALAEADALQLVLELHRAGATAEPVIGKRFRETFTRDLLARIEVYRSGQSRSSHASPQLLQQPPGSWLTPALAAAELPSWPAEWAAAFAGSEQVPGWAHAFALYLYWQLTRDGDLFADLVGGENGPLAAGAIDAAALLAHLKRLGREIATRFDRARQYPALPSGTAVGQQQHAALGLALIADDVAAVHGLHQGLLRAAARRFWQAGLEMAAIEAPLSALAARIAKLIADPDLDPHVQAALAVGDHTRAASCGIATAQSAPEQMALLLALDGRAREAALCLLDAASTASDADRRGILAAMAIDFLLDDAAGHGDRRSRALLSRLAEATSALQLESPLLQLALLRTRAAQLTDTGGDARARERPRIMAAARQLSEHHFGAVRAGAAELHGDLAMASGQPALAAKSYDLAVTAADALASAQRAALALKRVRCALYPGAPKQAELGNAAEAFLRDVIAETIEGGLPLTRAMLNRALAELIVRPAKTPDEARLQEAEVAAQNALAIAWQCGDDTTIAASLAVLGEVLAKRAQRGDAERQLQRAAECFERAIAAYPKQRADLQRAGILELYGETLRRLGNLRGENALLTRSAELLEAAVAIHSAAEEGAGQGSDAWCTVVIALNATLLLLGRQRADPEALRKVLTWTATALAHSPRETRRPRWANLHAQCGEAHLALGMITGEPDQFRHAVAALEAAIDVHAITGPRDRRLLTATRLGDALIGRGAALGDAQSVERARAILNETLAEAEANDLPWIAGQVRKVLFDWQAAGLTGLRHHTADG